MKNRHWLEFTEYASIAGVATGAVASFLAKQALYLSTPLSIALLVGFANRRRVERLNDEKTTASIATLKRKLSKQIKLMDQHIQTLPTPEMVGDVRNSTLRHSRDELKQLTSKIQAMQEVMGQYASILDEQNSGGIRDEIRQLQGFYTEIYGTLKQVQQTFNGLDAENKKKDVENLVTQLRSEAEQLQSRFQSLTDQTQPILSYLQEQVNHLNRQNSAILQQVDANSLKRELDILMDAVADLAPKRELNTVMADVRTLQENQDAQGHAEESLRKQLQTVMQRLQAVPDVPQFRAQIEETLSWKLSDINKQLRSLSNTEQFESRIKETLQTELETINLQLENHSDSPPYKLIFDLHPHLEGTENHPLPLSGSQRILEDALSSTQQRLIMVWPWSVDMQMDKPLMQKLEQFVRQGRQLDIGWCHIASPEEERFLSVINRRWSLDPLHRRSLQRTLQYLLALKRRYPKYFKFRVLGTVENFLVVDHSFAVLGIENRLTPISAGKDISLKLWTSDQAVIQQLTQTFEHTDLDPEDIESHWNRAITRYDLGDRAGAMLDINQVVSVNPNYAAAYNMRGIIQWDEDNHEAALADFDQSLSLDETQTTVYCNRGFIRSEQGDQYRAIADFSLAIQAETNRIPLEATPNSKLGIAYFYRGLACQKLDDFEGAIADYSEALSHVEASPVIRYHRGITYQTLNQYANAVTDLEEAVALFKQQGSQTNTRRASRHLAQAREALAVEESKLSLSSSTTTTPDTIPSEADPSSKTGQQSLDSSEIESSSVTPSLEESAATPSLEESAATPSLEESAKAELETSDVTSSSSAIPTFLFPDDSRSRPSMIQDMDAVSEAATGEPAPQPEELTADTLFGDSVAAPSSTNTDQLMDLPGSAVEPQTQQPEQQQLVPASEITQTTPSVPPNTPRRRRRSDLDKLVTSTLTNFFDEVDMEKLGTQTLDNFFAVVQDGSLSASNKNKKTTSGDSSETLKSSPKNQLPSTDGFEEVFNSSAISSKGNDGEPPIGSVGANGSDVSQSPVNAESASVSPDMSAEQADMNDEEIEKLVTSTLTNFFKDIEPEMINAPSPDFFEEVSTQDISEETLFNFHRVMDDVPVSTDSTSKIQEEQQELIIERQGSEQSLSEPEPPESDSREDGIGNISENEIEAVIASSPTDFLEAIDTEEIGTQTLGAFMETLQDAFVLDEADLDKADLGTTNTNESSLESSHDNPFHLSPEDDAADSIENPADNLGNEPLSNAQSFLTEESHLNGSVSSDALSASEELESDPQVSAHDAPSPTNSRSNPMAVESNGLSVGTETMSNLMAAIAEEDLGTQTLRDFLAIMGEEKAKAYKTLQATDVAIGEDEGQEELSNGKVNASEPDVVENAMDTLTDEIEASEPSDIESSTAESPDPKESLDSVNLADGQVVNPEEDSILFESLADFSDRF